MGQRWILAVRPDPDWKRAVTYGENRFGEAAPIISDYDQYYDSVIDVVDPHTGALWQIELRPEG